MKKIDTFYVLDYDRCLGNVRASFNLFKKVVHELSIIDEKTLQQAHDEISSSDTAFNPIKFVEEYDVNVDLDIINNFFLKNSRENPESLLEAGAIALLDFLRSTNRNFCIMSYGDKRWQLLKMTAAGLGDIPKIIVDDRHKSHYIAQWVNSENGLFIIPKECFSDNESKEAREVVLVDDRAVAFEDIPNRVRGYWVQGAYDDLKKPLTQSVPLSVIKVEHINDIINLEK